MKHFCTLISLSFVLACGQKLDGDGFHERTNDCDDDNRDVSPATIDICDGVDSDCETPYDECNEDNNEVLIETGICQYIETAPLFRTRMQPNLEMGWSIRYEKEQHQQHGVIHDCVLSARYRP